MDTHDEEFGRLMRKQIEADKKAKKQRDNTHAQGGEPSKTQIPPSLGLSVTELLFEAGKQWQQTEDLLRETVLRCNLVMPTSEEELKWFDEGCGIQNSGDFFERIYKRLNLGTENCKYCGGSGYDPYQNHDTTMRPCPKCQP